MENTEVSGIAIITGGTSGIALGASKVQFYTAKVVIPIIFYYVSFQNLLYFYKSKLINFLRLKYYINEKTYAVKMEVF